MISKMKLKVIIFLFIVLNANAQDFIPLWPQGKMPNSKGLELEHIEERERISQVKTPGMYAFFTSKEENKHSAVLICPPGGYQKLTYNIAGFQFAKWLNTIGVNAFVLIHRLPNSPDLIEREKGPVQDAQRAIRIIRFHSEEWGIDMNKIGILGASAGGHLASTLGTHNNDISSIGDSIDNFGFSPSFMILISAVINMDAYTHVGSQKNFLGPSPSEEMKLLYSNNLQVTAKTPPTFLVHAQNDETVNPMNSLLFYQAMLKNNIIGSLHVFPQGGHSIALRNNPGSTNNWTLICEEWLEETGFIEP